MSISSSPAVSGQTQPPSGAGPARRDPFGPARLLMTAFFGLVGVAAAGLLFLGRSEAAVFANFLAGQSGWAGAFGSSVFWKLFAGFAAGATAGFLFSLEIPETHLRRAARPAGLGAILLITLLTYIPAMSSGFIWDDDQEIVANPSLKTTHGLWEIWTGGLANEHDFKSPDYFPLKTTMLWLEYRLWGDNPHGYHTVNVIIHAVDALLLWLVLSQLRVPGAWLGSLLFAIHPVHAESVAWIAERKNTLSLFFYLLSISAYLRFDRDAAAGTLKTAARFYFLSLLLFVAAMLCKTSVVMLPVALLLYAWWKKGRLRLRDRLRSGPFFAVSALLGAITVWFQNHHAIDQEVIPIGDFWSRLAGAGMTVWWYLGKALAPVNLMTIYPRWPIDPPHPLQFAAGALALALAVLLFYGRKRIGRTPFFVYAYFVVTLFPVMGFFTMSYMRLTLVADHFQYLSDLSIVAFAGALLAKGMAQRDSWLRPAAAVAAVALAAVFSAYTWERAGVHQSEKTLWSAALRENEASWQAHDHYGAVLYGERRYGEAMKHFKRAIQLKPDNPEVHNNYGLTLAAFGHWDEAIAQYRQAIRIRDVPQMRRNLAITLQTIGRYGEAEEQYRTLLKAVPNDPALHGSLAFLFLKEKRFTEAKQEFEAALKLNPNDARLRKALAETQAALAKKP